MPRAVGAAGAAANGDEGRMQVEDTERGKANATGFRVFDWMRDVTVAGGLTGKGTAVAFALITMQSKGKVDAALMKTIAARAHTTLRSAERGLAELRDAGLVKVKNRYGRKGKIASAYTLFANGAWGASKAVGSRHSGGQVPATMAGRGSRHSGGAKQEEDKKPSRPRRTNAQMMAEATARDRERREQREAAAKCRYWTGQVPCNVCGAENLAACLPTTTLQPERNRP